MGLFWNKDSGEKTPEETLVEGAVATKEAPAKAKKGAGLEVKKIKEDGCVHVLAVSLGADQLEAAKGVAVQRIRAMVRLPGFRKGKAPLDMVKSKFEHEIEHEALDVAIQKAVPAIVEERKMRIVAPPKVDKVEHDHDKHTSLSFELILEVMPEFEAKGYQSLKLKYDKKVVGAADVEARIKELAESHARLEDAQADVVGKEHFAVADYTVTVDGKELTDHKAEGELFDMSSKHLQQDLLEAMVGMKKDETKEIPVKDPNDETRRHNYKVTLKDIKKKVVPAIDDEFAKDMNLENLADLNAKVKEMLEREAEQANERAQREALEKALIDANPIPVPPSLAEQRTDGMVRRFMSQFQAAGKLDDKAFGDMKERLRPIAENEIRLTYIVQKIGDQEKVEVTDADIEAEVEKNLAGARNKAEEKKARKFFRENREDVEFVLKERKVFDLLKKNIGV